MVDSYCKLANGTLLYACDVAMRGDTTVYCAIVLVPRCPSTCHTHLLAVLKSVMCEIENLFHKDMTMKVASVGLLLLSTGGTVAFTPHHGAPTKASLNAMVSGSSGTGEGWIEPCGTRQHGRVTQENTRKESGRSHFSKET